ncbi:MAG: hypothetical protein ACYTGH_07995 [Planctomycetota bacterium]|jgi:hypothetical protein
MTATIPAQGFQCPRCEIILEAADTVTSICPDCHWKGEVHLFHPVELQVSASEEALPEDAACAHHPNKKAVAICDATGDYICALCQVEVDGQTLSIQHLNSKGGAGKLKESFDRYLARPDRSLSSLVAVSVLFWPVSPITMSAAIYYYVKLRRARKENPILKRLVGRLQMALYFILIILYFLGLIGFGVALALD